MDASTIPRETSREAASLSVDEGWIAVGTILKWHSCITSYGVFLSSFNTLQSWRVRSPWRVSPPRSDRRDLVDTRDIEG